MRYSTMFPLLAGAALVACSADDASEDDAAAREAAAAAAIPAALAPFGDGYPAAGDPCRRLGESPATADWLDDSAVLVGCPTAEDAAMLGGEIVGEVEGAAIVSIPLGDANPGLGDAMAAGNGEDALVEGTEYNATAQVACAMDGGAPTTNCPAGVRRNAFEDGTTVVEITRPNGLPRAIFFQGTEAQSADSAEADGSAAYSFEAERRGDETVIRYGPERYVIPDALVVGG